MKNIFVILFLLITFSCATNKNVSLKNEYHNLNKNLISNNLELTILRRLRDRVKLPQEQDQHLKYKLSDYAIQLQPFLCDYKNGIIAYYGVDVILVHKTHPWYKNGIWRKNPIYGSKNESLIAYSFYSFEKCKLSKLKVGKFKPGQGLFVTDHADIVSDSQADIVK